MKSLFIAPMSPDRAGNGLAMRSGVFFEALHRLGEVEVLVLPVFGPAAAGSALCRELGIGTHAIELSGRAETHFALLSALPDPAARLEAFRRYGKPSASAWLSRTVLAEIGGFAARGRFGLVHVERAYLLPALGALPAGPLVCVDLDEDDARTLRRIGGLHAARGEGDRAAWLDAEAAAHERLVAEWLPGADLSFIATEAEAEIMAARHGVRPEIAPNAVAIPARAAREPDGTNLLLVGGFGYYPNLDAALWLMEAVFPRIRRVRGDATLTLVGRNPPRRLLELATQPGVELLDAVDDLAPLYARAAIALVPIRAGGGSRIKLLEAAAHGVPIVSTSAGAENTGFRDGVDIAIADTPDAFAEACLDILARPGEAARRASAAHRIVASRHSREAMISRLETRFRGALAQRENGLGS